MPSRARLTRWEARLRPSGASSKSDGKRGFADVFKAGAFAWEYKGRGADLDAAFNQLLQYSGDLGNPPLLIVSDMDRIIVRTRFTGFPTTATEITLHTFLRPASLDTLRKVFHDPEALRPEKTTELITREAAAELAQIAPGVRSRYPDPTAVAHFLNRLIFCLFAEDFGLLPNKVFTKIVEKYATRRADRIAKDVGDLFAAMREGGDVYGETIPWFNGNLFDESPALELNALELEAIHKAAALDWSSMEPSIFGTLFERVMDPDQRSQLGAHYTGFDDIQTLIDPVIMAPLRREWDNCRHWVEWLLVDRVEPDNPSLLRPAQEAIDAFLARLRSVRVLDPACGSGNFLYVALRKLMDLENEVLVCARRHDLDSFELQVGPRQLHGIEKNPYAFDLAQMTVWIGYLQWRRDNGFPTHRQPVLQALDNFENKDAILDLTNPDFPAEPSWPEAEFIVGNPPFLGTKKLRTELGDSYVLALFSRYNGRIPAFSDLCCYWFEKSREQIDNQRTRRVGLLATQGIRGGLNREVLKKISQTGEIFFAISDANWILDGANVHVSLIGFDDGSEPTKQLDGQVVEKINPNLTSLSDLSLARRLKENASIGYIADVKAGAFDISFRDALPMLLLPNPHGRPNSDVLRPWMNGSDVVQRSKENWIIDFAADADLEEAALYDKPFSLVSRLVKPRPSKSQEKEV